MKFSTNKKLRCKKLCDWLIKKWLQRIPRDHIGCLKYIQHIHTGHLHHFLGLHNSGQGLYKKLPIKNHRPWHLANLCAGNHELGFDPSVSSDHWALGSRSGHLGNSPMCGQVDSLKEDMDNLSTSEKQKSTLPNNIRSELTNCIYLEDSAVEICGLKVYGRLRLVL